MRTVHIGIRHDNDFAVAQLVDVEVLADGRSQSGDYRHQLFVAVYPVDACLFHVQHLAPERQDRLIAAVSAFLGRTARRVTLDDVQLCTLGGFLLAVCQLARQGCAFHGGLPACGVSRLFRRLTGSLCGNALVENGTCYGGVLLEVAHQLVKDHLFHKGLDCRITQATLGLTLELALRQLDGNDRRQTLPDIVAQQFLSVLEQSELLAVFVDDLGQSVLETGLVGTAVCGMDIIGKRQDQIVIAVVVLQSDFGERIAVHAGNIDHILGQCLQPTLVLQILHELADTALIVENLSAWLGLAALVGKDNADAGIQKRLFPEPFQQDFIVIFRGLLEDQRICLELNGRTGLSGVADDADGFAVVAPVEFLEVDVAAVLDGEFQPFRQGVYNGCTYAVQTAGDLIAAAAELTAGVEDGVHDGCRRDALFWVDAHRDASAVIRNTDHVFRENVHGDLGAESCQRLVNGVIYDLIRHRCTFRDACGLPPVLPAPESDFRHNSVRLVSFHLSYSITSIFPLGKDLFGFLCFS